MLNPKLVAIWFPNNPEALEYNRRLLAARQGDYAERPAPLPPAAHVAEAAAPPEIVGEKFTRKQDFTRPRTITKSSRNTSSR